MSVFVFAGETFLPEYPDALDLYIPTVSRMIDINGV